MTRLLLPVLLAAGAPPDYSQSRFEDPATARDRDVMEYVLTVRNTGEQPWYDPEDPARILVRRGPGGAYAFALLPLGLLVLTVAMLRHAVRPRRQPRA